MKRNRLEHTTIGYWKVGEPFLKGGKIYYHCECICGKKRDVYGSVLSTKRSLSCGCRAKIGNVEDITGKDIGWLHVEEKLEINSHTYWRCSCKCGNKAILSQKQLHDGNVKTCGCRGDVGASIKKSLENYCVDGTYIPGLKRISLNKNNTSGVTGVSFRKDRNRWRAYIKFQGRNIHLGNFLTFEDAVAVRKVAEKEYFGKYLDE